MTGGHMRIVFGGTAHALSLLFVLAFASAVGQTIASPILVAAQAPNQPATSKDAAGVVRAVGTIKSITDKSVTLATDAGAEVTIFLPDGARLLRVAPGQTDIKQATPITAGDLQVGDRILVRGKTDPDGKSLDAASVIAMARTDVAAKQAKDRETWQKHGLGGIVSGVDTASSTINISVAAGGEKKNVAVHAGKDTLIRRYAPDSIKFDDAKLSSIDKVQAGDQLRARGTRSPDGSELTADEIVSGTFRNISGTISAMDAAAGTIVVQDLATKKPVTVKVTADSQLRKLTPPVAQRIAARLKGQNAGTSPGAGQAGGGAVPATSVPKAPPDAPTGANSPGANSSGPETGRPGGAGGQGGGDLQQLISRMPAANLSDLQKGDAVMVVSTEGTSGGAVTAITLLAGVEPILEGSPKGQSSILSAWSLGGAPGGDAGTP
jgi:hypothetical protein